MTQSKESPHYRERLSPQPAFALLSVGLILMVALAYAAALDVVVGLVIAVVLLAAVTVFLWRSSPVISIWAGQTPAITVGDATLPLHFVAEINELVPEQIIAARRGMGDTTAFYCLRGSGAVLELINTDPADPHRSWLLTSRDPQGLRTAIETSR